MGPAPLLGEHTGETLEGIGYPARIAELRASGVIA